MFSSLLKKLLYVLGPLVIYHRVRNAHTLTVVMFHRVLASDDARWQGADPDYTLRADLFESCLVFFKQHYNIVNIDAVLAARTSGCRLPARALLITFDDGWADNVDHALPRLQALKLPALMFVVADAINRLEPFYQERIFGAWRRQRLSVERLAQALRAHGAPSALARERSGEAGLRGLIAQVEALPESQRDALLDSLAPELSESNGARQHMVSAEQIRQLAADGVAIGAHGKTHTPLTRAADLDAELSGARHTLAQHLPGMAPPTSLSFPHGRFDARVAEQVSKAGYELAFSSTPALNPVRPMLGSLLGRLGVSAEAVSDTRGRFSPERLALHLFRQPHRAFA